MKYTGKSTHFILKAWVRVAIVSILFVLLCISLLLIYLGKNPSTAHLTNYNYNIDEKLNYKVYLKDNDFFEEKYLEEGKQYTTAIIDYIDIDFNYLYNGSLKTDMNYKYDVSATIIGEYENSENGNAELWKKNYVLLQPQNKNKVDSTNFDLHQNLKIDYSDYSRVVDNFKSKFKLAIDAYLDVKLNVTYTGKINSTASTVTGTDTMEVKIPLSKTTIKIDTNYNKHRSKKLDESEMLVENNSMIRFGIIMAIFTIIIFLLVSPKIFISHKSYYLKRLDKIMKNYSEIIVEVESDLNFEDLEVLDIKTFDDMVDIEEEIKSPILYYEIEENAESWFIITTEKYLYRFILKK